MRTSSFEHIVRIQFNALMLIVIKNKVKSRNRQLARKEAAAARRKSLEKNTEQHNKKLPSSVR